MSDIVPTHPAVGLPQATVFICGCGHSGTSLMANMFASHPDVHIPLRETEAFMLPHLAAARWAAVLGGWRQSGRPSLAEKTPRHLLHLDRIRAAVPEARFVIMVRDGRDVAASFIKRFGSAARGAARWVADNSVTVQEMTAADVMVVRYEDLIADPAAVLRRVCDHAGLRYSPTMLDFHTEQRLWFDVKEMRTGSGVNGVEHRLLRNWQINQPIFDGRGQWKRLLKTEDLNCFEAEAARALLVQFGYPLAAPAD